MREEGLARAADRATEILREVTAVAVCTLCVLHDYASERTRKMATFTRLPSGRWRVQIRRKQSYASETFPRHEVLTQRVSPGVTRITPKITQAKQHLKRQGDIRINRADCGWAATCRQNP
jgi:hypothetical protein